VAPKSLKKRDKKAKKPGQKAKAAPTGATGAATGAAKARLGTATELAAHLIMSRQRVRQLTAEGVLIARADGRYDFDENRARYIPFLRDTKRSARTDADAGLRVMKARQIELKIAEDEGRLIELDEALAFDDELVGMFRTALAGYPARITRDLELRRTIERVNDELLTELANALAENCRAHEAGRVSSAPVEGAVGQQVGEGEPNLSA